MTKRHIGLLFSLAGILGVIAILIYDLIRQKSITPIQVVALAGCVGVFVMGATLIPLGDRPA
jgi:xanthosine utilization system XapX-like protein